MAPNARRIIATCRPPERTLRLRGQAFYDTTEVGRTRHDPTLRATGREEKRRIGGRRSPSIVRRRRGKDLGGIGQGSASSLSVAGE